MPRLPFHPSRPLRPFSSIKCHELHNCHCPFAISPGDSDGRSAVTWGRSPFGEQNPNIFQLRVSNGNCLSAGTRPSFLRNFIEFHTVNVQLNPQPSTRWGAVTFSQVLSPQGVFLSGEPPCTSRPQRPR